MLTSKKKGTRAEGHVLLNPGQVIFASNSINYMLRVTNCFIERNNHRNCVISLMLYFGLLLDPNLCKHATLLAFIVLFMAIKYKQKRGYYKLEDKSFKPLLKS